jgi:uncharacterized membrane protein
MNAESEKEQKRKKDKEWGIFFVVMGLGLIIYGIATPWAVLLSQFWFAGMIAYGLYMLGKGWLWRR